MTDVHGTSRSPNVDATGAVALRGEEGAGRDPGVLPGDTAGRR